MNKLRILITNNTLAQRAGTELYVYDLALALLARGHCPVAYSNRLGEVGRDLRAAGVPVIDNLEALGWTPDIIHGHHHLEVMTALLHFPQTPAIYFCHSWTYWEEMPLRAPRIRHYLAMNEATYNRLTCEHGIPEEQVTVLPNFVDLSRFRPRAALPARPRRALVFSNHAYEQTYLPILRPACARAGLALDVIGLGVDNPCARPWEVLGQYDLVFASGRSALEALAVGAAVIICSHYGLGPMVTAAELDWLRRTNLGSMATLGRPFEVDEVLAQIERYDAADAAEVAQRIRATAGLEATVDRLLERYATAIAAQRHAAPATPEAEMRAAAAYMRQLSDRLKIISQLQAEAHEWQAMRAWLAGENVQLQTEVATAHTQQSALAQQLTEATTALAQIPGLEQKLAAECEATALLQAELAWMRQSLTWRSRQLVLRTPRLLQLYRSARRLLPRP